MIVVTGGAGFIGSNLVASLEEKGYKDIEQLRNAPLESLQKIPTIGKEIAANIKKQVEAQDLAP